MLGLGLEIRFFRLMDKVLPDYLVIRLAVHFIYLFRCVFFLDFYEEETGESFFL